jgi:hypothetical protein
VTVGREHDKVKPNGKNWFNLRVLSQHVVSCPRSAQIAEYACLAVFVGFCENRLLPAEWPDAQQRPADVTNITRQFARCVRRVSRRALRGPAASRAEPPGGGTPPLALGAWRSPRTKAPTNPTDPP